MKNIIWRRCYSEINEHLRLQVPTRLKSHVHSQAFQEIARYDIAIKDIITDQVLSDYAL